MKHHLDHPIDTEKSYESFKARYRPGQSMFAQFDNTYCSLKPIAGHAPRDFVADPDFAQPGTGGDEADRRGGHYRGRKG